MCCVTFLYLVRKGPDNIQEQLCRQGKEKEGSRRRVLTSHSASSDSSAALLLFHPHAVSLSPSVFIQWLTAPACHTTKTAQKWLLWKLSPAGCLCHPSHSNIASCWVALSVHIRLFDANGVILVSPVFFPVCLDNFECLELCFSPLFLSNRSPFDNWCREQFQMQRNKLVDCCWWVFLKIFFKNPPGIHVDNSTEYELHLGL